MPRKCTICHHDEREAIDAALVTREPFRDIAGRFGVSKSSLVRHSDDHIPATLVKAQAATEAAQADDLLAQVCDLRDKALAVLMKAEAADDLRAAIGAIREARGCVELFGKLAGQLRDAPTINLFMTAEWREVQTSVLAALEAHPNARLAVAGALSQVHPHVGHA